jgi:hypothetical protein
VRRHQHVELAIKIDHAFLLILLAWKGQAGRRMAGQLLHQDQAVTASRVSMVLPPR